MKRNRAFDDDGAAPSLASVQPLDLERLADDLELSEQVRHSVQQIVDEWDPTPAAVVNADADTAVSDAVPSKSAFSAHPMRLWASLRRLWTAVVPDTVAPDAPASSIRPAVRLNSRPRPRQRPRRLLTAAAERAATVNARRHHALAPTPPDGDPFFTPSSASCARADAQPVSVQPRAPHVKSFRFTPRLTRIRAEERMLSTQSRLRTPPDKTASNKLALHRAVHHAQTPSSPSTELTVPTTPRSTPPKSPSFTDESLNSPHHKPAPMSHALSASSFASKLTSLSVTNTASTLAPATPHHTPSPCHLHEQLASLSIVDPPPPHQSLDDFFDVDIDDSDVPTNAFPTDDDISTMRLLRNRSQSTPEPLRRAPISPPSPQKQSALRTLRTSRTVRRVAKAAVQDVERLASLRRRITGDMRVDRRLAHLRLLQSQLRARSARLPSAEDAKQRFAGALDTLRERKRQALIQQQRRLSSSWRVPKLGDVPRNVKLPPLRRLTRRPKEQSVTSSPTDIRRTGYAG
ncbi:unnamed protein product [Agarophyton chilense]|eukprot:gb/GEZJ01001921.1/.p1 GENE.gb/GEZJ01001921.1/~~gb/GEZJ01001921.1/.p1  ORF type:complete len:531 (-),score=90.34 gb/GEZJ01001921.1/:734-2287(-)